MSLTINTNFNAELARWAEDSSAKGDKDEAIRRIQDAYESQASQLRLTSLGLNKIPSCIGKLSKLQVLLLNCNHLKVLPDEMGRLFQLKILALDYNPLTDLPQSLSKIPTLRAICAGGTGISSERVSKILSRTEELAIQDKTLNERDRFRAEELLFTRRPPAVQKKIAEVSESLRKTPHSWGHAGNHGFYYLLNLRDSDVIAQRIENASPNKNDLYFIDLGAGNFRWVDEVRWFLREKYSSDKRTFHVIGTTGEHEPSHYKEIDGNVITHKIRGFQLENLLESFAQFDLQLVNSVEFLVISWTLQHLVDALGTLEQAYHLLNCGNGFLFGTGFLSSSPVSSTLSRAFGIHSYIARRNDDTTGLDSFALFRSSEGLHSYAQDRFEYDNACPLIELTQSYDSYAQCYAKFNLKTPDPSESDFGGQFHGFGTYVLEQLLGDDEKTIHFKDLIYDMSLFRHDLIHLRRYLDSYGLHSGGVYEIAARPRGIREIEDDLKEETA